MTWSVVIQRFITPVLLSCAVLLAQPISASANEAKTSDVFQSSFQGSMPIRERQASPKDRPRTPSNLQSQIFASALGDIADMALGDDGEVFVLDRERGRLIELKDRQRDGSVDMTRILASGFDKPDSMTRMQDKLLVADQQAIWIVDIQQRVKTELVSLRNSQAVAHPRPMLLGHSSGSVYVGLTQQDQTSQLISVDMISGRASLIFKADRPIRALAQVPGAPLWIAIDSTLVPFMDGKILANAQQDLPGKHPVERIYLPTSADMTAPSLTHLAGKFMFVRGQSTQTKKDDVGGRNVVTVNSSFGMPNGDPSSFISGFISDHGRSAWGAPKAMVWDERGLFLGDAQNGVIWRISKLIPKISIVDRDDDNHIKFYETKDVKKPKASWGSSIDQASTILSGSQIGKTWEDDKLIKGDTLMERLRKAEKGEDEDDPKSKKD